MIKNERQYLITKKQADRFRQALADARGAPAPTTKAERDQHAWKVSALESQLATLDEELGLYGALQSAAGRRRFSVSIAHLPALLIQARIARGWTQRELAERLGLKMQQMQQYEASDYARASLTRIQEVCQALGLTGTIAATLVELPKTLEAIPKAETVAAGKPEKPNRTRRAKVS